MTIISVVICTYNREKYLGWLLESLEKQSAARDTYEIIIVDNNSTDATRQIAQAFCDKYDNARYSLEEAQGLSQARNRGSSESRGEYLAFIDDDAKAPENWLEVGLETISTLSPEVFGGPYYACFEDDKPRWAKDEYWSSTEWLGEESRWFDENSSLTGGNLFIKRDILEKVGGFNPEFGMSGGSLAYGEDNEIQTRLRQRFPSIGVYYNVDLYIQHYVREDKFSPWWYLQRRLKDGITSYRLYKKGGRIKPGFLDLPKAIVKLALESTRFVFQSTFAFLFRSRERYPFMMNYIYEAGHAPLWIIGYQFERARQSLKNVGRIIGGTAHG
jgi:glycosyltransferase involved in cell wall biosynthesis